MKRLSKLQRQEYAVRGLKYCYGCKTAHPAVDFHLNNSKGDGLATRCRFCVSDKLRSVTKICIDCGGPRSQFAANRCGKCHTARSIERREFKFFSTEFYFDRQAIDLLRNWNLSWPFVKAKLLDMATVAADRATAREMKRDYALSYGPSNYAYRTTLSLDDHLTSDGAITRIDTIRQEYR